MENIQLEFLAREFLAAYEAKDLQTISSKLAEGVVVKDWNLEVVGKTQVLREFAKNFEEASSLSIQIVQLHSSENAVAAELEIKVNEIEILHVVDVITFAENNEITSIVSYKGL
jgi:ketosteroid isomerase-like protein